MKSGRDSIAHDQLVMGIHTILGLLNHAPDRLRCLYVEKAKEKGRRSNLIERWTKARLPIQYKSYDQLSQMVGNDSHQGCVAHVIERPFIALKDFLQQTDERDASVVLMLDQIFDPQNLGAIFRSAECFGLDAIVFSKNRGADITPVVTKTSSGATELLPILRVSNLAEAVSLFQKHDFDAVAALPDQKSQSLYEFQFQPKTLLILGSEGEGIQKLIAKRADRSVYIPMQGKIESLNVAQTTSAILCALRCSSRA